MKKERKFNIYDLGFKEVCTKILTLIFYNTLLQLSNKLLVPGSELFFFGICADQSVSGEFANPNSCKMAGFNVTKLC